MDRLYILKTAILFFLNLKFLYSIFHGILKLLCRLLKKYLKKYMFIFLGIFLVYCVRYSFKDIKLITFLTNEKLIKKINHSSDYLLITVIHLNLHPIFQAYLNRIFYFYSLSN